MKIAIIDDRLVDFLNAYADYQGWDERGFETVARKLCENYRYAPESKGDNLGREFLMIAFGWLWGSKQDDKMPYIEANALCGVLQILMDEMYATVAAENQWDN
jgi:hypothetical protein